MKGKGESKTGGYSGRGVMVPMGPSFGSSDGSEYLGRSRRPRYVGSSGQTSVTGADTEFSSTRGLGRVNKGYEMDLEMPPMFSDQEDEEAEEDILSDDAILPISESRFRFFENRYNRVARRLGMPKSTLRLFVREMIRETAEKAADDMPSRYGGPGYLPSDILPYGQEYIDEEEQEEREDISDEYVISYKGDEGYRGYNARPEDLKEIALRRIIREEARKILTSDDDDEDDDDKKKVVPSDEASGAAAAGGGPALPLGLDTEARSRSIEGSRGAFADGTVSQKWMTYPIMGY